MNMNSTIISDKPICLSVGTYKINIMQTSDNQETFYLPDIAKPFVDNKKYVNKADITYTIELEDLWEESNEVVAQFDNGPFPYRIYRVDSNSYLWVREIIAKQQVFVYKVSKEWNDWKLIADNSRSLGTDSFVELAYIFAYSILNKGGILFHGVVLEWQERGFLFCAHSGVGKTTHTSMWRDTEDAHILNGDRALCCKEENRWYAYGAPWSGSSGECSNSKTPLTAIIILEQSDSNEVSFLSPLQGAKELMQLAFAPSWEEELMNCALDAIDDIIQNVRVVKLKCRPDLEAVAVLKAELQNILNVNAKTNNQINCEASR